jgi:hypothetical protein
VDYLTLKIIWRMKMRSNQKTPNGIHLQFSGRMVILVELDEGGVVSFQIDDKQIVQEVVGAVINYPESKPFTVNEQTSDETEAHTTLFKLFQNDMGES